MELFNAVHSYRLLAEFPSKLDKMLDILLSKLRET